MQSKKKMIVNTVFLVAIFALTIYGVFHGEDLGAMMEAMRRADVRWLLPGLLCVVFFIWGESIIIWYMMHSFQIPVKKRTCFLFSSVGFFFSCITPSASGGQPMQLYYMKKEKISLPVSTVILMIVTITYKAVLVVVGLGLVLFGQYVPGSGYPVQSMCPRTATDVVFEDMETGKVFRVINTHLDHECAGARKLGLEQILAHLRAEKAFADVPVILSGDFNAEPDSEEMKPLRETAGLVNATEGIGITFHNYHRDDPNDPQCSIDYIILKGDWELKKVEKWTEQKDGVCLSDHYPICAELI